MTLLNEADKIYLGSLEADAVYLGAEKVWPVEAAGPPVTAGMVHWLDASQLALADGAAVTAWPNFGTGAQPTIINTPPPVFKSSILNGKPVVRFITSQGALRSVYSGAEPQNYTLLYIVRWVGNGVGRAFSAQYPPSNFLVGMHTSGRDRMYDNGTWLDSPDGIGWNWIAPGPWRMYEADGVFALDSRFFIDGVRISTVGPGNGGGLTNGWGLSGYENSSAETMDIEVAELLLYDHRLTDPERVSVEGYLRTKWGLP